MREKRRRRTGTTAQRPSCVAAMALLFYNRMKGRRTGQEGERGGETKRSGDNDSATATQRPGDGHATL